MDEVTIALHSMHVLFAVFWFGSLLYTELILWPQLRRINQLEAVQGALRQVAVRKLMAVSIWGTVITGFFRGITGGVVDRLYSGYGIMFVCAAIVGIAMTTWWSLFPTRDRKLGWRMFYSSFWIMYALMIGMRFDQS